MQSFLYHHARSLIFPDRASSWLTTLAHYNITVHQPITLYFVRFETHLANVIQFKSSPSDINIRKVRQVFTLVVFLVEHFPKTEFCYIA